MGKITLKPTATDSRWPGAEKDDKILHHDAFGKIRLSRSSHGGGKTLFGSELKHNHVVSVTITRASSERAYHHNRVQEEETIVEFDMSEAQWSHMVSSSADYSGTPITLDRAPPRGTKVEEMPNLDLEDFAKTFDLEIKAKTKAYVADITELVNKLKVMATAGGAISKNEFKAITREMDIKLQNLPSNMGFIQEMLEEGVDKIVTDAKIEIEATINTIAHDLGMEQLRQMAPRLEDDRRVPTLTAIEMAEIEAEQKQKPAE